MDLWQTDKLVLFVAFVVPGFVALKTYELLVPRAARDSAQQVIDAVAYSCINYALLFWPIYEVQAHGIATSSPRLYALFYAFVLLLAPVSWACLFVWLRNSQFFQSSLPHPTGKPWDFVFGQRQPYWVIVTLKDGRKVAGRYDSKSFASSAPAPEQLYLQEAWVLNADDGFDRSRSETAGILVLASDVVTIELFEVTYGDRNG
jgi:hypothetical protein